MKSGGGGGRQPPQNKKNVSDSMISKSLPFFREGVGYGVYSGSYPNEIHSHGRVERGVLYQSHINTQKFLIYPNYLINFILFDLENLEECFAMSSQGQGRAACKT